MGDAGTRDGIQDGSLNEDQAPKINQMEYPADDCEQDGLMEN